MAETPAEAPGRPAARLPLPALISPLRFHSLWVAMAAIVSAILILALYLLFATRFTVTAQIAFDTGNRIVPAERFEALALDRDLIGRTVDRPDFAATFGIDRSAPAGVRAIARARAVERVRKGLQIEQSDLTNMVLLRYTSGSRRLAAPILNDLADGIVRGGERPSVVRAFVVSRAADPVAPDGVLLFPIGLALLGGMLTGVMTLLVRERLQKGPRSPRATERVVGLPVVGLIPAVVGLPLGQRRALTELPVIAQQSDYSRGFRRLLASGAAAGHVVAVCSAVAAEGKSTSAISLARTASLTGRRVVIVDCDGRMRAASEALDVLDRPGLIQVMDGAIPLDQALVPDTRSNMMILAHSQAAALADFWSRDTMAGFRDVIATLSRTFDLVVIDTPPLLALAEARDIAGLANEALIFSKWRATPVGALRLAADILAKRGIRAGIVLSFVRLAEPDRGPIVPTQQRRRRPGHNLVLS